MWFMWRSWSICFSRSTIMCYKRSSINLWLTTIHKDPSQEKFYNFICRVNFFYSQLLFMMILYHKQYNHLKLHYSEFVFTENYSSKELSYSVTMGTLYLKLNHSKKIIFSSMIIIAKNNYITLPWIYIPLKVKPLQKISQVKKHIESLWYNFHVDRKFFK